MTIFPAAHMLRRWARCCFMRSGLDCPVHFGPFTSITNWYVVISAGGSPALQAPGEGAGAGEAEAAGACAQAGTLIPRNASARIVFFISRLPRDYGGRGARVPEGRVAHDDAEDAARQHDLPVVL